jgi:hypothetical protein
VNANDDGEREGDEEDAFACQGEACRGSYWRGRRRHFVEMSHGRRGKAVGAGADKTAPRTETDTKYYGRKGDDGGEGQRLGS